MRSISQSMKDVLNWLKTGLMWVGIVWVICMVGGTFGAGPMRYLQGPVIYAPVPRGLSGEAPSRTDAAGKREPGILPMLPAVRIVPYNEVERQEYGIRPQGILPAVEVPQYPWRQRCP